MLFDPPDAPERDDRLDLHALDDATVSAPRVHDHRLAAAVHADRDDDVTRLPAYPNLPDVSIRRIRHAIAVGGQPVSKV
jgi:hypothetical protein